MVVGERKGGEAYFALDVTSGENIDSSNTDPAPLWRYADGDLTNRVKISEGNKLDFNNGDLQVGEVIEGQSSGATALGVRFPVFALASYAAAGRVQRLKEHEYITIPQLGANAQLRYFFAPSR